MKNIIIVGAGGFAREIYEIIIKAINEKEPKWNVLGFIDDNLNALDGKKTNLKILGRISDWKVEARQHFVMGIANPRTKEKIASSLLSRGAIFESIIHPSVRIVDSARYGTGLVAYPGAALGPDVTIGDFVTLLSTGLGHDVEVGDYSTISSYCGINGYVKLGKYSFVGGHAVLAPNIRVGDDGFVGVGSVVVSNVKSGTKVFGNPARRLSF
jgi:sugar O-acyltransferase (sialic acid O-acetyltransferase NeuD family)